MVSFERHIVASLLLLVTTQVQVYHYYTDHFKFKFTGCDVKCLLLKLFHCHTQLKIAIK